MARTKYASQVKAGRLDLLRDSRRRLSARDSLMITAARSIREVRAQEVNVHALDSVVSDFTAALNVPPTSLVSGVDPYVTLAEMCEAMAAFMERYTACDENVKRFKILVERYCVAAVSVMKERAARYASSPETYSLPAVESQENLERVCPLDMLCTAEHQEFFRAFLDVPRPYSSIDELGGVEFVQKHHLCAWVFKETMWRDIDATGRTAFCTLLSEGSYQMREIVYELWFPQDADLLFIQGKHGRMPIMDLMLDLYVGEEDAMPISFDLRRVETASELLALPRTMPVTIWEWLKDQAIFDYAVTYNILGVVEVLMDRPYEHWCNLKTVASGACRAFDPDAPERAQLAEVLQRDDVHPIEPDTLLLCLQQFSSVGMSANLHSPRHDTHVEYCIRLTRVEMLVLLAQDPRFLLWSGKTPRDAVARLLKGLAIYGMEVFTQLDAIYAQTRTRWENKIFTMLQARSIDVPASTVAAILDELSKLDDEDRTDRVALVFVFCVVCFHFEYDQVEQLFKAHPYGRILYA